MKLNNRLLSMLMIAGMAIPMGTIQAWPSALFERWGKKAEKAVVQEAQNSKVAEYALAGAKLVGKAAVNTALFTAKESTKFAWNNPKLAAGLVAGGYIYYKRNDIKDWCNEKIEQTKQLVDKVAPVALTAAGGKILYDLLAGSNNSAQKQDELPKIQVLAPKKSESVAVAQDNFDEYDALWNEFEASSKNQAAQERVQRMHAQMQPVLSPQEVKSMDVAWNDSKVQAPETIKRASIVQTPAEKEEAMHYAAQFERQFNGQDSTEMISPSSFKPNLMAFKDQENTEARKWVDEYHSLSELKDKSTLKEWLKEYKAAHNDEEVADVESISDDSVTEDTRAMLRASTILRQLMPKETTI